MQACRTCTIDSIRYSIYVTNARHWVASEGTGRGRDDRRCKRKMRVGGSKNIFVTSDDVQTSKVSELPCQCSLPVETENIISKSG